jgi:hypothetical protein
MEPDSSDLSKLSARELLLRYRKQASPGVYFYIGKDGNPRQEDIMELYIPSSGKSQRAGQGVVFGFIEKRCPPPELDIKDLSSRLHLHPFTHYIGSTSIEFQEKLASHIRTRLLKVHEPLGCKTSADK